MRPLPVVGVLLILLAFAVSGHLDCRVSEACRLTAVTHNEVMN